MSEAKDPFGPLAQGAITANEMYRAYLDAGFTETQALEVVKDMNRTALLWHMNNNFNGGSNG